jgi:hypothetical protein
VEESGVGAPRVGFTRGGLYPDSDNPAN